jgi:hypothetical protein
MIELITKIANDPAFTPNVLIHSPAYRHFNTLDICSFYIGKGFDPIDYKISKFKRNGVYQNRHIVYMLKGKSKVLNVINSSEGTTSLQIYAGWLYKGNEIIYDRYTHIHQGKIDLDSFRPTYMWELKDFKSSYINQRKANRIFNIALSKFYRRKGELKYIEMMQGRAFNNKSDVILSLAEVYSTISDYLLNGRSELGTRKITDFLRRYTFKYRLAKIIKDCY